MSPFNIPTETRNIPPDWKVLNAKQVSQRIVGKDLVGYSERYGRSSTFKFTSTPMVGGPPDAREVDSSILSSAGFWTAPHDNGVFVLCTDMKSCQTASFVGRGDDLASWAGDDTGGYF